jgi:hypothetical protein
LLFTQFYTVAVITAKFSEDVHFAVLFFDQMYFVLRSIAILLVCSGVW